MSVHVSVNLQVLGMVDLDIVHISRVDWGRCSGIEHKLDDTQTVQIYELSYGPRDMVRISFQRYNDSVLYPLGLVQTLEMRQEHSIQSFQ